jgi:hypothetical protein
MRAQYNLNMYGDEFRQMKWVEFAALLSGISAESPLGRLVQIRTETDPDIIKHFTTGQKRIHADWQRKKANEVSEEEMADVLASFKQAFLSISGGVTHE